MASRARFDQPKLTVVDPRRVSSVIPADEIIVLEDGAIVERGTLYRPRLFERSKETQSPCSDTRVC